MDHLKGRSFPSSDESQPARPLGSREASWFRDVETASRRGGPKPDIRGLGMTVSGIPEESVTAGGGERGEGRKEKQNLVF